MEKIVPWAKKNKLVVIEDCAQTCGGDYSEKNLAHGVIMDALVFKKLK